MIDIMIAFHKYVEFFGLSEANFQLLSSIALGATLVVGIVLSIIMGWIRPKRWLDKALFLREVAIVAVLVQWFFGAFIHEVPAYVLTPIAFFLLFSAIAVLVTLILEHLEGGERRRKFSAWLTFLRKDTWLRRTHHDKPERT